MTLRARIRIAPSRLLAAAGALAVAGAVALPLTVVCAWFEPAWLFPVAVAALLGGALVGLRVYRDAMAGGPIEAKISEEGNIELLGLPVDEAQDDTRADTRNRPRGPCRLAAGSLAWPGISVLALEPVEPRDAAVARRGVVRIAVLRRDLDAESARRLHRFMLWSLRGGTTADASSAAAGWSVKT